MDFFNSDDLDTDKLVAQATDMGITILAAILVLVIGLWLAGFVERRLNAAFKKSSKIDPTVSSFMASLAKYAVIIFTGIALLDQFGIETTSLVAVLGAAGLAIGLALQGTLSNLAAGVMLLIFRPFRVGQFVEVGGHAGTVKGISLFLTKLDTGDNVRITIPNNSVWGSSIRNFNHHDTRRLQIVYGIGYGDDIDKAMEIIKASIEADERCMNDPEPVIAVTSLGESSVDIMVRVWCASGDYWALNWHLLKTVKERFDAEGVSIPFPCRTIYQGE
ncbi:mechanosensitive ion channel family protein [Kordiimonas lacus]|uniref:Small-conductance mechanosensitive channel n=1 Tax=Kordiimonas lacus TaxID=637679 RepID=A0A1G6YH05_9PROT|nr:mechanosensitive ion channel domain-containing protein [Kordiimonas lacus]SDD89640.1 small conductance mechanosensitive channel [Kordiimonas lacus]